LLQEVRRRAEERELRGKVSSNRLSMSVQPEERAEEDDDEDEGEKGTWEHEAEEMFSDARMEALVRELGI
jgi:hypothetical protein